MSNQKCMIQPILINLHPNEYSQELHYYPFAVKLDRCGGSRNTLNDLSNKVCVPNKTDDVNTHVFNMITGKNKIKNFNKTCECKCKFLEEHAIQIKSGITINVDASVKNIIYLKKIIFGILLHVAAKMVNI